MQKQFKQDVEEMLTSGNNSGAEKLLEKIDDDLHEIADDKGGDCHD